MANNNNIIKIYNTYTTINCIGTSVDGITYFCSRNDGGILKLDNETGDIVPTNKTDGTFNFTGNSADGITYFCGDSGIWKVDKVSGDIIPTNKTDGDFTCIGTSVDGITYFCSENYNIKEIGILKLDNETGDIIPTNITDGTFSAIGNGVDGITYFCGDSGIWKVDNETGDIVPTNKTDGSFSAIGNSADGTTYFCAFGGIWKVDKVSGDIIIAGAFPFNYNCLGNTKDGITFFGSAGNGGIDMLNNETNTIIKTNITYFNFYFIGNSIDGTTYFGTGIFGNYDGSGILKYDNLRGNIVHTNITNGSIYCIGNSADGTTYFGGYGGIWKLDNVIPPFETIYRWIVLPIENYMCDGGNKYYTQKRQVSYDEGITWEDVIPLETKIGDLYEKHSLECKIIPKHCKYYSQKKQVSYDNGITWEDVYPKEIKMGALYETNSFDCGYRPTIYRWVLDKNSICEEGIYPISRWIELPITDYICIGFDKHYKERQQISKDNGITWLDTVNLRRGKLIEANSKECGYVGITGLFNFKFVEGWYSNLNNYTLYISGNKVEKDENKIILPNYPASISGYIKPYENIIKHSKDVMTFIIKIKCRPQYHSIILESKDNYGIFINDKEIWLGTKYNAGMSDKFKYDNTKESNTLIVQINNDNTCKFSEYNGSSINSSFTYGINIPTVVNFFTKMDNCDLYFMYMSNSILTENEITTIINYNK